MIRGRQSETGWEYSAAGSENGDDAALGKRERGRTRHPQHAFDGRPVPHGATFKTSFRTVETKDRSTWHSKFMVGVGELIAIKETFPSGKSMTFTTSIQTSLHQN